MDTKELNTFMKNYIESSKLRSAILINGPWGIGKSFYIENSLVPFLKKECNFDIVKISLYGITSIQELTKQIYLEIRAKKFIKKNEGHVGGKLIAKAIFNGVASFFNVNTNISENDLQKLYTSLDLTNKVLIFEDLERSNIDIPEVLGFINTLVDQDKVKVILVANENEITKHELKYNEESKKMEFYYTQEAEKYLQIKEKTISETILFSVDLEDSILSIAKIFDNKILNNILTKTMIQEIINVLKKSSHENLRTIIFAFQKTIDIFNRINTKQKEFVYNKILKDIVDISIRLKSASEIKSKEEIKKRLINDFTNKSTYFCCTYILNQSIDEFSIVDGIVEIIKENDILTSSKPDVDLQVITNFYNLEDKQVQTSFNNILNKLENETFNADLIGTLISYAVFLKDIINFDYAKLKQLILKYSKPIDLLTLQYSRGIIQENEENEKEYIDFIQNIETMIKSKEITTTEKNLNTLLINSKEFYNYVSTNKENFLNKRKFMSIIDIEKLTEFINNSKNVDITNFRYSLQAIYSFANINEYYLEDISNIYNLYLHVENHLKETSEVNLKNLSLKWLMNDLKNLLKKFNYNF